MCGVQQYLLQYKKRFIRIFTQSLTSSKGQSAIEYLTTYGWMLLVVAIVGGSIFATVQGQTRVESVSGLNNAEVQVEDFGVSNGELRMILRAASQNQVERVNVSLYNSETGERIYSEEEVDIPVAGTKAVSVLGVRRSDVFNTYDLEIGYDSGGLEGLVAEGSMSGRFQIDKSAAPMDPFVMVVDTSKSGSTGTSNFNLRTGTEPGFNYNISVNGSTANSSSELENLNNDALINWNSPGHYEVKVTGEFPHMEYNVPEAEKISKVRQWGDIRWENMSSMFEDATNMRSTASDNPDLSEVQDISSMFENARSFNGSVGSWDTSSVTDMRKVFEQAKSFNKDISSWDTSGVTDMNSMFREAIRFNRNIDSWDTSSVTDMHEMFYGAAEFNRDISSWDTSSVTDMGLMFGEAGNFSRDISGWCVSQIGDKPDNFDTDSGFEGQSGLQPNWAESC